MDLVLEQDVSWAGDSALAGDADDWAPGPDYHDLLKDFDNMFPLAPPIPPAQLAANEKWFADHLAKLTGEGGATSGKQSAFVDFWEWGIDFI